MIGLDTNVLLRYVVKDDAKQYDQVVSLLENLNAERPGYVNLIVLVEFVWSLRRRYRYNREQTADAVVSLLTTPQLQLEERGVVAAASAMYRLSNADLADILIAMLNEKAGCTTTVTFDKGARRLMTMADQFA